MPSGRQIFAFFCSAPVIGLKISGAVIPLNVFTQPGSMLLKKSPKLPGANFSDENSFQARQRITAAINQSRVGIVPLRDLPGGRAVIEYVMTYFAIFTVLAFTLFH
jgi:hypothetical protein